MKVLMINGSPHTDGNTALALKEMGTVFAENNIDYEIVNIGTNAIRGCIACGTCHTKGQCVFDDMVNEVNAKFKEADGLVVGSPVYYASANASVIALLDRMFYSSNFDKTMKVGCSVVVARRGGLSSTFDELKKADNATQAQMVMYSKLFKINFTKMDPYEFKTFTDILQRYSDLCKPVKGNGRGKKKK